MDVREACMLRRRVVAPFLAFAFAFSFATSFAADSLTIPRGQLIDVRVERTLRSTEMKEGDTFPATVLETVYIHGHPAIAAGSTIGGVVTLVRSRADGHRSGVLGLRFAQLRAADGSRYAIDGGLVGFRKRTTDAGEVSRVKTTEARAVVVIGAESDGPAKRPSSLVGNEGEDEEALATRWAASGLGPDVAEIDAGSELTFELRQPLRVPRLME
jgi:hypothetical protein